MMIHRYSLSRLDEDSHMHPKIRHGLGGIIFAARKRHETIRSSLSKQSDQIRLLYIICFADEGRAETNTVSGILALENSRETAVT